MKTIYSCYILKNTDKYHFVQYSWEWIEGLPSGAITNKPSPLLWNFNLNCYYWLNKLFYLCACPGYKHAGNKKKKYGSTRNASKADSHLKGNLVLDNGKFPSLAIRKLYIFKSTWMMPPSFSTKTTREVQITPRIMTVNLIIWLDLFSLSFHGREGLMKSSKIVPAIVFKPVDIVLNSQK